MSQEVVKNACRSYLEFGFEHLCQEAHSHLELQHPGDPPSLASE